MSQLQWNHYNLKFLFMNLELLSQRQIFISQFIFENFKISFSSAFQSLFKLFVTTEAVVFFHNSPFTLKRDFRTDLDNYSPTIPQQRGHGGYIDGESDKSFMLVRFYPFDLISFCCLKWKYFRFISTAGALVVITV